MKKFCALGDSVLKGVVYDSEKHKYSIFKDSFINSLSKFYDASVNNFSKLGCTVTKGLCIFDKHEEDIKQSDYLVLEFGGNDCDFDWEAVSNDPQGTHYPKTPIDTFYACYKALIEKAKKLGAKPILLNLPPIDAKKYFAWISRNLNQSNILSWLGGDENYIYTWHEMYNLKIVKLAKKEDVPIIDIRSAFLEHREYKDFLCEDGIHPNQKGHAVIAKAIEDAIRQDSQMMAV